MDKAPDAFRTISEVADELDVPQHVLRFWETRFGQIKPMKRGGGRRYYRPDDVDLLRGIRHLLYGEGYTIRGVQRILKDDGVKAVQAAWKVGAPPLPPSEPAEDDDALETVAAPAADARPAEEVGRPLTPPPPSIAPREPQGRQFSRENFQASPRPSAEPRVAPAAEPIAPPATPPVVATAPEASSQAGLPRDDVRRLQATLYELGECRRLLEVALKDDG